MAREKSIKIRLTEEEFNLVQDYAKNKSLSISEVIRDYIKTLRQPTWR
ncbi:DNA-binding protein [Brasilonema sp. UFV-L1]|nr:DNA-binding protein [Brasilonema sp. UFV-L1]